MKRRNSFSILIAAAIILLVGSVFFLCFSLWSNRENSVLIETRFKNPKTNILFLSSTENSYSFNMQEKGVRSVLLKNNVNLDIEFYEPDAFNIHSLRGFLKERIMFLQKNTDYGLVIVSGKYACDFVDLYYEELFKGMPVVFFCIGSNSRAKSLYGRENFYGFLENHFLDQIFSVVRKVYPYSKNYVAVYDRSVSGYENLSVFAKACENYSDINMSGINASLITREELGEKLSELSEDSIVFYLGASSDINGAVYSVDEQVQFLVNHTDCPIFSHNSDGIGYGIIGGKMIDYEKAGKLVAQMAVNIINGKDTDIPLQKFRDGLFCFDYSAITQRHLNPALFPRNSVFVNMQEQAGRIQRGIFFGSFGVILSLLTFVSVSWILMVSEIRKGRELKSINSKMEYMIEHDYLTDLPNRFKARSVFNEIQKTEKPFSLIFFDIDDFKNINTFYSHSCGDEVLKAVSSRLLPFLVDNKFYAFRFGGDEFLVLYTEGHLSKDSPEIEQIKSIFKAPVIYNDNKIFIQASFGIVNSKDDRIENMISDADIALYRAKKKGKGKVVFFNEDMRNQVRENNKISKILDDAIANDGITVVYQPQIDVNTGEIHGYEALMRLKDSDVSPSKFIPVAEETGQIVKIDRILTEKVIRQMAEWREHGIPLYKVSINYSYSQISDVHYVEFLEELLIRYKISSKLIGIEITESLFISNKEKVLNLLDEFVKRGITLALDDFGTGYSSLSYLTFLPINVVKIDKSIVDNYLSAEKSDFIKNIVRLVHSLEMKLTVEGVENQWQNEKLRNFHCDYIQGYYYSKPISGAEIEEFNRKFKESGKDA